MRSPIFGGIAILLSIFVCALSARAYKLVVPEHVDRDTINITRADYEQALNKWRSRGAIEYEISVSRGRDSVQTRVNEAERKLYLLKNVRDLEELPVSGLKEPADFASFRGWTVEGLFETAEGYVAQMPTGGGRIRPGSEEYDYFYDFTVQFDPNLGYPTYLSEQLRTIRKSREITWRTPVRPPMEVKSLVVIR